MNKKNFQTSSDNILTSLMPHNTDVEARLLNIIISDFETLDEVLGYISEPDYFYKPLHQEIFRSILNLKSKGQTYDMAMIAEELHSRKILEQIGGVYELAKIQSNFVERHNLISFCEVVKNKYLARELIKTCQDITVLALEGEIETESLLDDINTRLEKLSLKNVSNEGERIDKVTYRELEKIEQERKLDKELVGLTSGLKTIDDYLGGFQGGRFYILAARPSVGKTAMALNFAYHSAKEKTVLFLSYEMPNGQLARRLMSIDTKVAYSEITTPKKMGDINFNKLTTIQSLVNRKIILDDSCLNLNQLTALATRLKKKEDLGMIIIDYIQLMPPPERCQNREQEIAKLSRGLKQLSTKLDVPIIALSQLSREIEKTGNRQPKLSDLRESGALEQDANAVLFLWGESKEAIKVNPELSNVAYLSIGKNRDGEVTTDNITLGRFMNIQTFYDKYSIPQEEPSINDIDTIESNPYKGIRNNYDDEILPF